MATIKQKCLSNEDSDFIAWTREALVAEIKALRSNVEAIALLKAEPYIESMKREEKRWRDSNTKLNNLINSALADKGKLLIKEVDELLKEKSGFIFTKSKLDLENRENFSISYHYRELKRALTNKDFYNDN